MMQFVIVGLQFNRLVVMYVIDIRLTNDGHCFFVIKLLTTPGWQKVVKTFQFLIIFHDQYFTEAVIKNLKYKLLWLEDQSYLFLHFIVQNSSNSLAFCSAFLLEFIQLNCSVVHTKLSVILNRNTIAKFLMKSSSLSTYCVSHF